MTREEEFMDLLGEKEYSYETEGDKIVVTNRNLHVDLDFIETLPPDVKFENRGYVDLGSLTALPPGAEFKNGGGVYLESLTALPPEMEFKNGGDVDLRSLKALSPGVEFNNMGDANLRSLMGAGRIHPALRAGWFDDWGGNIEDIDSNRLLNKMISIGLFDRR